ncbi:MAG: TIGR00730 family Rossman fold protein, partial [Akkermansiaceae bacterium]|nr:TIGR00730 family Rossman fold protein [Akkermansiaceae bacterium]
DRVIHFDYFSVRKAMLLKYSSGFICMPGGVGTMDEIFYTATLIQTGKIPSFPLVVMGYEFWEPLRAFLRDKMFGEGTLTEGEVVPFYTDVPEEAASHLRTRGRR